jgi:M6 family metalloprotease-like protein
MEYLGEKHQLLFLVDFSDLYFQDADPAALWKKVFNQKNFQEPPFHGSVHDYFYEQSFEQFELVFDVYYVHMDKNHAEYRSGDIDFYDDTRSGLLLTEILDIKKEEIPDWSIYDWDDDGYINQVVILFAGKGQNDGGDNTTIWSHQWWLSSQSEAPYYREWGHPYPVSSGGHLSRGML